MQSDYNCNPTEFKFDILEYCDTDSLIVREKFWIIELDCVKQGYNTHSQPVFSRLGKKLTKKQCAQFSKTAKEVMNRPEVKERVSKSTSQAMQKPEMRKHLSQKAKQRDKSTFSRGKEHGKHITKIQERKFSERVSTLKNELPREFDSRDIQKVIKTKYLHPAQSVIRKLLQQNLIVLIKQSDKRTPSIYAWRIQDV